MWVFAVKLFPLYCRYESSHNLTLGVQAAQCDAAAGSAHRAATARFWANRREWFKRRCSRNIILGGKQKSVEWYLLSLYFKVCICVYQVIVDVYVVFYLSFVPTSSFQKGIDPPILVLPGVPLRNPRIGKKLLFFFFIHLSYSALCFLCSFWFSSQTH